jgi:hypothetical protein
MLTEDYLMRMINLAMAALLQALGLRKAGQYGDAQQAIDQAVESLIGLRADLARRLDDRSLLENLTRQGELDLPRLEVVADLYREEREILQAQGREEEAFFSSLRAFNFYLEAALSQEQISPELREKIRALDSKLSGSRLPEETLFALLSFYEGISDDPGAQSVRNRLAGN